MTTFRDFLFFRCLSVTTARFSIPFFRDMKLKTTARRSKPLATCKRLQKMLGTCQHLHQLLETLFLQQANSRTFVLQNKRVCKSIVIATQLLRADCLKYWFLWDWEAGSPCEFGLLLAILAQVVLSCSRRALLSRVPSGGSCGLSFLSDFVWNNHSLLLSETLPT